MTAKEYVNGLTFQGFEKIRSLSSAPGFYQFVTEACKDPVLAANFAMQCRKVGVPDNLVKTPESLHYLAAAINYRQFGG